ncbi:hypothetical protein SAMN05216345_11820 [Cupriavidus sp. YR651]|nr:hypothetical protein SAMN05216345_11820 [Cupriavidus sp. YR651]
MSLLNIDRSFMKYASVPLSRAKLLRTQEKRPPEQPGEARKTTQPGQTDPQSKQVADLSDAASTDARERAPEAL